MAEEKQVQEPQTTGEETEGEQQEGVKKKKSSVLMFAIIGLLIVIVAGGGYFLLTAGNKKEEEVAQAPVIQSVFFEMPEIIVSLSGNSSNIRYLKLVISVELTSEQDQQVVEKLLPKITDEYQTYLRQLRLEDLRGSVGTYRLKEALLLRINQVVQPVEVKDVLLKEMLIQ